MGPVTRVGVTVTFLRMDQAPTNPGPGLGPGFQIVRAQAPTVPFYRYLYNTVGADYLLSPRTIMGFALAGGATSFSVANGGSGRSDLFQAGAFVRHSVGQAYISGALAYDRSKARGEISPLTR